MDAPTFASFVAQERARIQDAIKAAQAKRREAEHEIEELETELTAIAAYETARKGTKVSAQPRARRGEKRQTILNLIAQHPEGMTRRELLHALNAHDKSGSQSVSNALSALKKTGLLTQEGKIYRVQINSTCVATKQ
jgi:DNA-binding transcriptional ArsR family regulator